MISICIPNYNYERYLGLTLESVLSQDFSDLEVVVADNASTDNSVGLLQDLGDPRIRVAVNACNVGFAGNLDRAASMAKGDRMIMLSSDDLMRPSALATYDGLLSRLGGEAGSTIVCSSADKIDSDGGIIGRVAPDPELWTASDLDTALSEDFGVPVYRVASPQLLRRALLTTKNPFNFLATNYARALYEQVEGYGGGRLINPDKWFHLRLLGAATQAVYIDDELFAYRWHDSNQTAIQSRAGALKYHSDEYSTTLSIDDSLLAHAGLQRSDVVKAFAQRTIGRHGLATLAKGNRKRAKQILDFGRSVYPDEVRQEPWCSALSALLAIRQPGRLAAAGLHAVWRKRAGGTEQR